MAESAELRPDPSIVELGINRFVPMCQHCGHCFTSTEWAVRVERGLFRKRRWHRVCWAAT